jgi:DNA-binding transcriptional ArsR family regulator
MAALLDSMTVKTDTCSVCDLTDAFEVKGPTISHHLRVLREAGLIDCERRGTWVYYWVLPAALARLSQLLDTSAITAPAAGQESGAGDGNRTRTVSLED